MPRLERVLNVENHISKPMTRVTKIHTKTIHEWTLSQVWRLVKMSPGIEVSKVANIRPASAKAPLCVPLGSCTCLTDVETKTYR